MKVPNPPGSGKVAAEGKGVHREVESEGSRVWGTYSQNQEKGLRAFVLDRRMNISKD